MIIHGQKEIRKLL